MAYSERERKFTSANKTVTLRKYYNNNISQQSITQNYNYKD